MLKGSVQAVRSWPLFLIDRTTDHAAVVLLLDRKDQPVVLYPAVRLGFATLFEIGLVRKMAV